MNLIVFGAGASVGSDKFNVPPLGNELLDSLIRFNPNAWGRLPPEYVAAFRNDFEQGMQQLSNSNPHMMPPLQRAMAAYFFSFFPTANSLYRKLASRIRQSKWKGALVTFNYERLLELSLIAEGLQPVVGRVPIIPSEIEVCLPHGCCHLFCESVRGRANAISFSGTGVTTSGPIKAVADHAEFRNRIINDAFPPVMSYFEPQKRTTSGMNFVSAQRSRYRDLVLSSSKIAIVGLKVRSHDTHIWNPLAETHAAIIYCSGKEGGNEFKIWTEGNRLGKNNQVLDGYFCKYFNDVCNELDIQ